MSTTSLNLALTNQVWLSALPKGLNKPVLLAYCRHANDASGLSWPSINRVALMCGLSERAVQGHVRALVQAGILRARLRTGHATRYTIHLDSLQPLVFPAAPGDIELLDPEWQGAQAVDNSAVFVPTPVDNSSLTPAENDTDPRRFFHPPPQKTTSTPAESAPITVLNSKENREGTSAPALPVLCAPASPVLSASLLIDDVKPETLESFRVLRKTKLRSQSALTGEVIEGLRTQAHMAGITLEQALQTCVERKWARFDASWLKTLPAGASAAPITVAGAAPWVPPVSTLAAPEVRAAGRAKLAALRAATLNAGGVKGCGWAQDAIDKHKAGQPVRSALLRDACAALRLDLSSLSATPPAPTVH